ncbi:MAG: hypothetical protein JXX14_19070 [Deltaproteobacteria bacterium]|nr:hypothetical protein [Deltaproteobacteria bacterium]
MNKLIAAICLGTLLVGSASAQANPNTHDGFYLQMAAGLGGFRSSVDDGGVEATYGGLTLPAQIFVGGTIAQHLVLSGGFFLDTAPAPKFKIDGNEVPGFPDFKQFLLGIGMMADFYVWSNKGLHFPFFMGWGGLETSTDQGAGGSDPTGLMIFLGAGYDFFIADEWSFGVLFRLVVAPLKVDDVKFKTIEPGILATITFN